MISMVQFLVNKK